MALDGPWVVVEDVSIVNFVDPGGRKWSFAFKDCSSIESSRRLIAKELGLDEDAVDFSIGDNLLTTSVWNTEVKPGADAEIAIILSPPRLRPSPSSPLPPPPASTPPPSSVPHLESLQHILTADGYCTLPILGCESRVFRIWSCSDNTGRQELGIYGNLRHTIPPGRWADLGGNLVTGGRPAGVGNPEISIGPALAGRVDGIQDMGCRYVVFQKSTLAKTGIGRRDESTHLDGDVIYRWLPYASQNDTVAGLVDPCRSSFSVVENWAEVESDASNIEALRKRYIGEEFTDGERRFFAIVGSRDK